VIKDKLQLIKTANCPSVFGYPLFVCVFWGLAESPLKKKNSCVEKKLGVFVLMLFGGGIFVVA
jgi:hypothetical protein